MAYTPTNVKASDGGGAAKAKRYAAFKKDVAKQGAVAKPRPKKKRTEAQRAALIATLQAVHKRGTGKEMKGVAAIERRRSKRLAAQKTSK